VRVLLDTHALLWWMADSRRLSTTAHQSIANEANDVLVSAASAWEISTKFRIGKLPGGETIASDIAGRVTHQGFTALVIDHADAERAGRLPGPHRDPFDRMLIAQALARGLPVVSLDEVFDRYGVNRIW
jgi:PIN domain nuclease of toxin-antitoxin system